MAEPRLIAVVGNCPLGIGRLGEATGVPLLLSEKPAVCAKRVALLLGATSDRAEFTREGGAHPGLGRCASIEDRRNAADISVVMDASASPEAAPIDRTRNG
jgi:hypothetical protein